MSARSNIPELMPRLTRGAHRSPRRGACFMEFASYLAGERWSDHPDCTDPVLASLARSVNDSLSDDRRDELVHQIPRVVGLRGVDAVVGLVVALRAAVVALPVVSMERQRSLAIGILVLQPALAERGATQPALERDAERALADVPDAAAWASRYVTAQTSKPRRLHLTTADTITRIATVGIAAACIPDPDSLLISMLTATIDDVEPLVATSANVGSGVAEPTHQLMLA